MSQHGRMVVGTGVPCRLGRDLLTGGAGGSRAGEAQKSCRWVQGPAAREGFLRRALDAVAEPVTLAACREGARPPWGAAA
jgi:hypothetical protein